jgi:hypothetical protein
MYEREPRTEPNLFDYTPIKCSYTRFLVGKIWFSSNNRRVNKLAVRIQITKLHVNWRIFMQIALFAAVFPPFYGEIEFFAFI